MADIPAAVGRAVAILQRHPQVESVGNVPSSSSDASRFECECLVRVNLPNRLRASGVGHYGVRAVEPVRFTFENNFPRQAPSITLRPDFDRTVPHIQPGPPDSLPTPCLFAGDINEALLALGFSEVVNQLTLWLTRAANDELIDYGRGWEPARRDMLDSSVVFNSYEIRRLAKEKRNQTLVPLEYARFEPAAPGEVLCLLGRLTPSRVAMPKPLKTRESATMGGATLGRSFAIIASSRAGTVCDKYLPDTVSNLSELQRFADASGCGDTLARAIRNLRRALGSNHQPQYWAVVLCVVRPTDVEGQGDNTELLPYYLRVPAAGLDDRSSVWPAAHREEVSPELLERLCGLEASGERTYVLAGCGSVGGKIATHLSRCGWPPRTLIDPRNWAPHNVARHALLPFGTDLLHNKAVLLGQALGRSCGVDIDASDRDVTTLLGKTEAGQSPLGSNWALVNTTASLRVREALAASLLGPRCRVIEASLYGEGALGVMTIEGPARNPTSLDLIARFYHSCAKGSAAMRKALERQHSTIQVGQGCSTMTVQLPDPQVSSFAASFSSQLLELRNSDLPSGGGQLRLGVMSGCDLNWTVEDVGPFILIPVENAPDWEVRLCPTCDVEIGRECKAHDQVETGGVLIGVASEIARSVSIVHVLPPPVDSRHAALEFVLGTEALKDQLKQYLKCIPGGLGCVGTWHSHLVDSGPSNIDISTCGALVPAGALGVMLIRTPTGYRGLLADPAAQTPAKHPTEGT